MAQGELNWVYYTVQHRQLGEIKILKTNRFLWAMLGAVGAVFPGITMAFTALVSGDAGYEVYDTIVNDIIAGEVRVGGNFI